MTKVTNNPKEKMRMNIELADNGIIIRNPECEDEVTLAISGAKNIYNERDLSNEYKAIGQKIYDWLLNEVLLKNESDIVITNFDIEITAACKGHEHR